MLPLEAMILDLKSPDATSFEQWRKPSLKLIWLFWRGERRWAAAWIGLTTRWKNAPSVLKLSKSANFGRHTKGFCEVPPKSFEHCLPFCQLSGKRVVRYGCCNCLALPHGYGSFCDILWDVFASWDEAWLCQDWFLDSTPGRGGSNRP